MNRKVIIGLAIVIFFIYLFLMVVVSADRRNVYAPPFESTAGSLKLKDTLQPVK